MTSDPVVSVILPAYNRAASIGRAIASAAAEAAATPLEVVVVDDGSADGTAEIAEAANPGLVRVLRHDRNRGAAAARNTAIAAARGRFLAFLDSDDCWLPGKLERQLAFMAAQGLRACCTAYRLLRPGRPPDERGLGQPRRLGLRDLAWGCYVSPGTTLVIEREAFLAQGPFKTSLRRYEDWDWLLRFAASGQVLGVIPEVLAEIHIGGPPAPDAVEASLAAMRATHLPRLLAQDPRAARCFRAGCAIERASLAFNRGRPLAAAWHVLRSLAIQPWANQAVAAVVLPRLLPGRAAATP